MTTRQLVQQLQAQGYSVKYHIRRDGGILIQSINGAKFKGAKGNIYARQLLGVELSQRRSQQLSKITRERIVKPRKIPVETPNDLERFRKRVMRKWRKAGLTGSISKRNLRKIIEERGFEGAKTYLTEMERHTQGKAYFGAIEGLLARIENDMELVEDNEEYDYLQRSYDLINSNKDEFKQEWLFQIFDQLYNFEQGQITASAFYLFVSNIIQ